MSRATVNRRQFLHAGTAAAVGLSLGIPRLGIAASLQSGFDPEAGGHAVLQTPAVHEVLMQALDSARRAGAQYADVRVTYARNRSFGVPPVDTVTLGLGVRALVDGVWGFATSPRILSAEGPRLGQRAVAMAKSIASRDTARVVDLEMIPVVQDKYVSPYRIDPFTVSLDEVIDWGQGLEQYVRYYRPGATADAFNNRLDIVVQFRSQERIFASTEGSLISQTFVDVVPRVTLGYQGVTLPLRSANPISLTGPRTFGWEVVADAHYQRSVPDVIAACEEESVRRLPSKPFDIGRYDLLIHPQVVGMIIEKTLAPATQLDRALGYETNATGSSYLGPDPMAVLGTPVAASAVTLTANRSRPGGLATVRWDDDGVAPADFPLIQHGTLIDYQTTREQAPWLQAWYTKQGVPVRSHGCSWSAGADYLQIQHTPNLVLEPDPANPSIDTLREHMATGVEVAALCAPSNPFDISIDQQCLNGLAAVALAYEVRQGKRVARLVGAVGCSFRSLEFWKNVTAVGGASTQARHQAVSIKDEPQQRAAYSIDAVPIVVKQQAVIDYTRKT